jgi:hypothetical protein
MFGAESTMTPNLPGVTTPSTGPMEPRPNPFQGIRRAGQAKRAQNFAKFQQKSGASGTGAKNRMAGGDFGTLVGSQSKLFS